LGLQFASVFNSEIKLENVIFVAFRLFAFLHSQGHFQTSSRVPAKSVDLSTADMRRLHRHVGFVPIADMQHRYSITSFASASNLICKSVSSALAALPIEVSGNDRESAN